MARLEQLQALLKDDPNDAFLHYGVAMELAKAERLDESLQEFAALLKGHPDYVAGYFMAGRTCEQNGDNAAAKKMYKDGIAAAQRTGDAHAAGEISAALTAIE